MSQTVEAYEDFNTVMEATTVEQVYALMGRLHSRAEGHMAAFVLNLFFLGAAVARVQVLSYRGDDHLETISSTTGINTKVLFRARELFRVFGGSLQGFIEWRDSWIEQNDRLLTRHIDGLITVNKDRRNLARAVEEVNESTRRLNEYPGYDRPYYTFEEVVRQRNKPLKNPPVDGRPPKDPRKVKRLTCFSALRQLAEDAVHEGDLEREIPLPDGTPAVVSIRVLETA